MKNIITIILLFIYCYTQAQVPGYLGKRFSIEGNINILPRFTEKILKNYYREQVYWKKHSSGTSYWEYALKRKGNKNYKAISLNLKSSFSLNYVLSRKIEASLNFTYLKNSLVIKHRHEEFIYGTIEDEIAYKAFEFDLNFRFYRKNVIAPMGKYFTLGIGVSRVSTRDTLEVIYVIDNDLKHRMEQEKVTFFKYNLGYGSKRLVKNNVYLMYEVRMNFYKTRKYSKVRINNSNNLDQLFKREVGRHISYDNFLNLKVGIGIIL